MSFLNFFRGPDINQGIKEYESTPGALLLDVRISGEYREGHIPRSKNISLQDIDKIASVVDDKNTPIFVYCYSGSRSRQAAGLLGRMGYTKVKDLGGIAAWKGKVEG